MSVKIQRANFQDLVAAYYAGTSAHEAAGRLRGMIEAGQHLQLANLLRDYRNRSVYAERVIEQRAAVDNLLICYDVMEIAILTGFIRPPDRSAFWKEAEGILDNKHVRKYYEKFYPQPLPQLLLRRIKDRRHAAQLRNGKLIPIFLEFLALDRRFMNSLNDGNLLKMLDSFKIKGCWFSDIVAIVRRPKECIRRLLCPPEKRGLRDQVLYELSLFMQFCFDLHLLLKRLDRYPLLQSAMWSHYGYWFGIIGPELNAKLGKALNQFLEWKPEDEQRKAAKEIQRYVSQARRVLKSLTTPRYGRPVNRLLKQAS